MSYDAIKAYCAVCGKELPQCERGRRRVVCGDECRKVHRMNRYWRKGEANAVTKKCFNCGKSFERDGNSIRVCCSKKCAHAFNRREVVEEIRLVVSAWNSRTNPGTLRDWALALYHDGDYKRKPIAEALGIEKRTLINWIRGYRYAEGKSVRKSAKKKRYNFITARTGEEWIAALRRESKVLPTGSVSITGERRIYLICGTISSNHNADYLSDVVRVKAGRNPMDGAVYALCGKKRKHIRYMFWDGNGFSVVNRRREQGTYPWPSPGIGAIIPISKEDFELVLNGERTGCTRLETKNEFTAPR